MTQSRTHTCNELRTEHVGQKVKIVGYPQPIREATDFWRDDYGRVADVVCVEWVISVDNPLLCDFNIA